MSARVGVAGEFRRRLFLVPLVVLIGAVGLVMAASPAGADVDTVSGSATALFIGGSATAPGVDGSATEPTDGYGPIGSGLLPSDVVCPSGALVGPGRLPIPLSVGLLDACTRGAGLAGDNHLGFAESSSAVAGVVIGDILLGVVRSSCRADGDGAVGSTQITGSGIAGLPTNPAPNSVVSIPGPLGGLLTLTLNQQIVQNTPGTATISVAAVRLNLLGVEVILAYSQCTALGPDVNLATNTTVPTTTTTTTTVPTTTTTTTTVPTTTTLPTTTTALPTTTTSTSSTAPTVAPSGGGNNTGLALTGSRSRLVGLAVLLIAGVLLLATRTLAMEEPAVPGSSSRHPGRRSLRVLFSPFRRQR